MKYHDHFIYIAATVALWHELFATAPKANGYIWLGCVVGVIVSLGAFIDIITYSEFTAELKSWWKDANGKS